MHRHAAENNIQVRIIIVRAEAKGINGKSCSARSRANHRPISQYVCDQRNELFTIFFFFLRPLSLVILLSPGVLTAAVWPTNDNIFAFTCPPAVSRRPTDEEEKSKRLVVVNRYARNSEKTKFNRTFMIRFR